MEWNGKFDFGRILHHAGLMDRDYPRQGNGNDRASAQCDRHKPDQALQIDLQRHQRASVRHSSRSNTHSDPFANPRTYGNTQTFTNPYTDSLSISNGDSEANAHTHTGPHVDTQSHSRNYCSDRSLSGDLRVGYRVQRQSDHQQCGHIRPCQLERRSLGYRHCRLHLERNQHLGDGRLSDHPGLVECIDPCGGIRLGGIHLQWSSAGKTLTTYCQRNIHSSLGCRASSLPLSNPDPIARSERDSYTCSHGHPDTGSFANGNSPAKPDRHTGSHTYCNPDSYSFILRKRTLGSASHRLFPELVGPLLLLRRL